MDHSKNYKNRGKDVEDLRRRRNEVTIELRKNKREEALLKKRNINLENENDTESEPGVFEQKLTIEELQKLVISSMNPNYEEKLLAVKTARKLLSSDKNPPIDEIISVGILPALVDALKYDDLPVLQFEAAWALTNIASGTSIQTRKVVEEGTVPILIKLLRSPNDSVAEQSLWALGNIIGDGPDLRDYVLDNGLLASLISIFERNPSTSFLRNLSWVIVNMCRNKNPPLSLQVLEAILPILCYLLMHIQDASIIIDVVWSLSYITDHGNEQIEMVIRSNIVQFIVHLLDHEDLKIQTPALRVIGNIVTGSDEQTQFVLDLNVLHYVPQLLDHNKEKIKKETLWFLSNITAGRVDQIQKLIDLNIIPSIIEFLDKGSFQLQKEAAWAISNMTMNGTREQVKYLVEQGVIKPICYALNVKDNQVLQILLEALIKIFQNFPDNYQLIADEIEKCQGLDSIEQLQNHENEEIYKHAFEIIDKYFDANDDIPELLPDGTKFTFNTINSNENTGADNSSNNQQPFQF